ncbi:GNAT family N-acetyltransferase [Kordiimonas sp. SCSIO 12603]|uniref:GNAT family N-acetyltransferase n=1 Tax=Kordiimonas sp. SCSIO 12603 TaxID=2829596 RepID=UPI002103C88B|nr:GNAT family N-acetyltransferase [Kordiimonas sp. SCSIO 12603]UTW58115.1 GNAT family N-acetyltransferase [Kordiimonas sp. SCSIO 12603]
MILIFGRIVPIIDLDIRAVNSPEPYWDLLLLADPSRSMIEEYLADGKLFAAAWEETVVGVFVIVPLGENDWELKNIAVSEEWQGKGVGKALIEGAIEAVKSEGGTYLEVGTGNSSIDQIAFYQKAGFRMQRIAKNFFTLNYPDIIIENGIECRDMIVFGMDL